MKRSNEGVDKNSGAEPADVVLAYMPFGSFGCPSLAPSLLRAALAPIGVSTKLLYFTLRFAQVIGPDAYNQVSRRTVHTCFQATGEWIFADALFNDNGAVAEQYIEQVLRHPSPDRAPFFRPLPEEFIESVLTTRGMVDCFLDESLRQVLHHRPRIVGFSTVFEQLCASLALAKRIKAHSPETFIVFGGAGCEGVKGIEAIRKFPFVDAVVSGDGDLVFPEIVKHVLAGESASHLQGVYTQEGQPPRPTNGYYPKNAPSVSEMDSLPFIDYDDFLQQYAESGIQVPGGPLLYFETARGCWWARCTFCSLKGSNHAFRAKSASRALEEMSYLHEKYPGLPIQIVDNILDTRYFKTLFPKVAKRLPNLKFACEVKTNSSKEQIRTLWNAGAWWTQPGIESLSTSVLKLMDKGVTALQNIQVLKWLKEFGLDAKWNILWGFPAESPDAYEAMARLIPSLVHLHPPGRVSKFSLSRFSLCFESSRQFGFANVRPSPAYREIFPFDEESVANLATYFAYDYRTPQCVPDYTHSLNDEVAHWKEIHTQCELFSVEEGDTLLVWDERPVAVKHLTTLSGLEKTLYMACDSRQSMRQLQGIATEHASRTFSPHAIEELLDPLLERHLMMREGNSYLSLAIPVGVYKPRRESIERFHRYLNRLNMESHRDALMANVRLRQLPGDMAVTGEELRYAMAIGQRDLISS